jgi:hypothetical protein
METLCASVPSSHMGPAEWAAVASAGLAAIAAAASWATVWQAQRNWRVQQRPRLHASWVEQDDRVQLIITNLGGGYATQASFIVVSGNELCVGDIPPFALAPHAQVTLNTKLTPRGGGHDVSGVIFCISPDGFWDVWSWSDDHKRLRRWLRRVHALSPEDAIKLFHPELDLHLEAPTFVAKHWWLAP